MALTTYTYSISGDTPNGKLDAGALHNQIVESDVTVALDGVSSKADEIYVVFKSELGASDLLLLDDLVAAHSGEPIPDPTTKEGIPFVKLSSPMEKDGKPVFVSSPAPEGLLTYFTGRGDDPNPTPPSSGRGMGNQIRVDFSPGETYPQTKTTTWSYIEPTWTHDGQLTWSDPSNFNADDHFSLSVKIPATVATVADPAGTGNVNLVPSGLGYNVIVPSADGTGTHNVDLSTAAPVPTTRRASDGYWDVDEYTGIVTPAAVPGTTWWHLLDIPVQSYFIRCAPMLHHVGVFDVDVYKTDWVPQTFEWELEVHKETAPTEDCSVAGWLLLFRENAS